MLSLQTILVILLIHWIADFVLQTSWQAENKSSSNKALVSHTGMYSLFWLAAGIWYVGLVDTKKIGELLLFVMITFVAHTLTDYFTSRQVKKFFAKKDYHNGFVVIGFDQILHYTQLFLTFICLT